MMTAEKLIRLLLELDQQIINPRPSMFGEAAELVLLMARLSDTPFGRRALKLGNYESVDMDQVHERRPADTDKPILKAIENDGLPRGFREITLRAYTNGFAVKIPEQKGLEVPWQDDVKTHNCQQHACEFWCELGMPGDHMVGAFGVPSPPKRVRMLKTARPDPIVLLADESSRDLVAHEGQIYEVSVNTHGAVSAVIHGRELGLRPGEFEAVEDGDLRSAPSVGSGDPRTTEEE